MRLTHDRTAPWYPDGSIPGACPGFVDDRNTCFALKDDDNACDYRVYDVSRRDQVRIDRVEDAWGINLYGPNG